MEDDVDDLELSDYSETIEEGIFIRFFQRNSFFTCNSCLYSFLVVKKTVAEVPVLSAEEEKKPIPTYSAEELNELAVVLKRMVFLDGIKASDWNDACDKVIHTWFLDTNHLMLIVFHSSEQRLTVSLTYPTEPVLEIVYFLREPDHIFTSDSFHDDITFGHLNDDVDGTFLLLMEKVYTPIFFHKTDWSETNRTQFLASIHLFLSRMTSLHFKLLGLTYLYVPTEGSIDIVEEANEDIKLVKRLEIVAEHWINQLRDCLSDSEQVAPYELLCPIDEYKFWIYRCE